MCTSTLPLRYVLHPPVVAHAVPADDLFDDHFIVARNSKLRVFFAEAPAKLAGFIVLSRMACTIR